MAPRPLTSKGCPDDITTSISNESDDKGSVVDPAFSIGSSEASMKMAQYLDSVESAGTNDISSFQDVDLSNEEAAVPVDKTVRMARKRYYLMPMLIQYSLPIAGCFAVFLLLLVTVAVTANTVRRQYEITPLPSSPGVGDGSTGGDGEQGQGEDTVGDWHEYTQENDSGESVGDDALTFTSNDETTGENKDDGFESVGEPESFTTEDGQDFSGDNSSTPRPEWYSTSHETYQSLLASSTSISPHRTSALFCEKLSRQLCSYSTYCPSGKSATPYMDGPPDLFDMAEEEWEQWSPVNDNGQGVEWVQVGKLINGAGVDEDEGRCWKFDEWNSGTHVSDSVGAEHRRWILCCDI